MATPSKASFDAGSVTQPQECTFVAIQPLPMPSMDPNAAAPIEGLPQQWKHGLFDCLQDLGLCVSHSNLRLESLTDTSTLGLVSCFIPCTVYARNKSRYEHLLQSDGVPHPELGDSCNGDCVTHGILCTAGCGWFTEVRYALLVGTSTLSTPNLYRVATDERSGSDITYPAAAYGTLLLPAFAHLVHLRRRVGS
jgi:hypothetical protein